MTNINCGTIFRASLDCLHVTFLNRKFEHFLLTNIISSEILPLGYSSSYSLHTFSFNKSRFSVSQHFPDYLLFFLLSLLTLEIMALLHSIKQSCQKTSKIHHNQYLKVVIQNNQVGDQSTICLVQKQFVG